MDAISRLAGRPYATVLLLALGAALLGGAGLERPAAPPVALDVPYLSTPHALVDRMLQMADVGPDDYVIDLGSGDGRIVIAAARDYGARGLGVDIDPERVQEAEFNAAQAGVAGRVSFRRENLFDTDLGAAEIVTMYLLSSVNLALRPRILELEPGTRIVSHAFQMGEWQADETAEAEGARAYLWVVPANVAGNWRLEGWGEGAIDLTFRQEFQRIEGVERRGNGIVPLAEASLRGEQIRFALGGGEDTRAFAGRVRGSEIIPEDESETWRAVRRR